jgi:hypothetical protein
MELTATRLSVKWGRSRSAATRSLYTCPAQGVARARNGQGIPCNESPTSRLGRTRTCAGLETGRFAAADKALRRAGQPGHRRACRTGETRCRGPCAVVADFCKKELIDLVVVGPEAPLVAASPISLRDSGIRCLGRPRRPRNSKARRVHQGSVRRLRHPDRRLRPVRQ